MICRSTTKVKTRKIANKILAILDVQNGDCLNANKIVIKANTIQTTINLSILFFYNQRDDFPVDYAKFNE